MKIGLMAKHRAVPNPQAALRHPFTSARSARALSVTAASESAIRHQVDAANNQEDAQQGEKVQELAQEHGGDQGCKQRRGSHVGASSSRSNPSLAQADQRPSD